MKRIANSFYPTRVTVKKQKQCLILLVCFTVLTCLSILTFGATQKKKVPEPQQDILERLHPKPTERPTPSGFKLLPGYKHKGAIDFEGNSTGEIWKRGGLKIKYVMGFSWGQEADPNNKMNYLQYWEQTHNGRLIRFAFTKKKVFIVSVPLDDAPSTFYAANFSTSVIKPDDAADMVMMALTLITNSDK